MSKRCFFDNALVNNQLENRRVLSQHYAHVIDASPESIEQGWALLKMVGCDCYRVDIEFNGEKEKQDVRVTGFITEPKP